MDLYITALYGLAEYCGYGNLHDKMICDRMFVILHLWRSYSELTITKAVTLVCKVEVVK